MPWHRFPPPGFLGGFFFTTTGGLTSSPTRRFRSMRFRGAIHFRRRGVTERLMRSAIVVITEPLAPRPDAVPSHARSREGR